MMTMTRITQRTVREAWGYRERVLRWAQDQDRGDVPGWVLVTVMTAGLVAVLWLVAEPLLRDLFSNAVSSVTGP